MFRSKNAFVLAMFVLVVLSFVACGGDSGNDYSASSSYASDDYAPSGRWHGESKLDDGTPVCTMGAMSYLNCDRNSTGYHSFDRLENGDLTGTTGAMTYLIDSSGNPLSAGFHEITPNEDGSGYTAEVGASVVHLDRNGDPISGQDKAVVSELEEWQNN